MKTKLSKIFIAFTMLFTMIAVPKMEVKANNNVEPYALITVIPVQETTSAYVTFNASSAYRAKVCVDLDGEYSINNSSITNVNLTASVEQLSYSGTTVPSSYTIYVESLKKTIKTNGIDATVTLGLKTASNACVFVSNPPKFTFSV